MSEWDDFRDMGVSTPTVDLALKDLAFKDPVQIDTRCDGRTDVHGRCALWKGHDGNHVNALGQPFVSYPRVTE